MLEQLWQSIIGLPGYLFDANKRVYLPYLFSAILMAIPVYFAAEQARSGKGFLRFMFPKRVWWCQSAKLDYCLLVTNRLIKAATFTPIVLTMVPVALALSSALEAMFGPALHLDAPEWVVVLLFTLFLFIVDDLTRFLLHLMLHKIPFLWEFHKVHHSASVLTPFTIYRSHPIEITYMRAVWRLPKELSLVADTMYSVVASVCTTFLVRTRLFLSLIFVVPIYGILIFG